MSVRVLLADDQALVRAGFRVLVETAPDLTVVGEAANGGEAVRLAGETGADVVLMDIRMPGMDGLAATREITKSGTATRVLVLTTFEIDEYVFAALRAGASGFLGKSVEAEQLQEAIRVVARGEALLSPSATQGLITRFLASPNAHPDHLPGDLAVLTEREREIMILVATGLTNDEIALRLGISRTTVKTHVNRAMLKLGAHDRAQLVIIAYETGMVRPRPQ
ncbi:DNA-binding response regulator, NarL/FixJ family, contains REC and HTH domains [Nonomuraea solani]|uniref:DNA-binding response regulator, NarL/FixJ family, contains REC and HTH domains n=1 Tax=Nonomuraea solani TaxID=1144553 RepID=A0A1H6ER81_9ACTN|nr:response regulator transcription factor [Nonomuraea solani]SEG99923.1 DNA-binding response regulator, NarL/FixJ family, contains REC and HTH domains [Nonomuraea solani]